MIPENNKKMTSPTKRKKTMEEYSVSSPEMTDKTDNVYERGRLYSLSLNDLLADPDQPRKVIDAHALEELTASIRKHGILEPILFRRHENTNLVIVAGERRIIAARKAGLTSVPALYIDGNSSEISLIENLLRQDLTAVEEAEALQRLLDQQKYTHEQLSSVIGKARTTLSDILLINRLPQDIRDECRGDRTVSKNTLIGIARRKQERAMLTAYGVYKEKLRKNGKTRKKRGESGTNVFEVATIMAGKMLDKLNGIDATRCEVEDHSGFRDVLINLRAWIDSFLTGPAGPSEKKEERIR